MTAVSGKLVYVQNAAFLPQLKKAVTHALESAGLAFELTAKQMITDENHIVTGRYRNSINSQTNDGHHEMTNDGMTLETGTNVEYAIHLEKRYAMLARAQEAAKRSMLDQFQKTLQNYLK